MSEYTNIEHPFLEKLREIGWKNYHEKVVSLQNYSSV